MTVYDRNQIEEDTGLNETSTGRHLSLSTEAQNGPSCASYLRAAARTTSREKSSG
jgi:hypothetical protein